MKKRLASYEIQIYSLEEKLYDYEFTGDETFFEEFNDEESRGTSFKATVKLEKSATMLRLAFSITAEVRLQCDRSLEYYDESLQLEEKYIFKFGDRSEVVSEDMEVIPFGTSEVNIAQHLYDYISLAIPVKKIHPSLRAEDESDEEIDNYVFIENFEDETNTTKQDPRWDALTDLKNKLEGK